MHFSNNHTIEKLNKKYHSVLSELYEASEIDAIFFICLETYANLSRLDLQMNFSICLTEPQLIYLDDVLYELSTGRPLQYIIGKVTFMDLFFDVNKHTLIPRPETEELVDLILENYTSTKSSISVLDIGTGSGCIPISLKYYEKNWNVTSIDVSEKAIEMAKLNAVKNAVEVNFICEDILVLDTLDKKYDLIVSNPPYIIEDEKKDMANNVLSYEPHLALFVDNSTPLLFYKKILELAINGLAENGIIYFEINPLFVIELNALTAQLGFSSCEIINDMSGKERFARVTR